MGKTLQTLARAELAQPSVFDRRFVVEVCERFHVHYRNLRLQLNLSDFLEVGQGFVAALERWGKLGRPEPAPGTHVELCRRDVARDAVNDGIRVNLNENLYARHEGKIFAEGAGLTDPTYVHVKVRDLRLEMTLEEFRAFAGVVKAADEALEAACAR